MPQTLRVRLLGDLQVDGFDMSRLGRRQVRTLLKILALHHDRPVTVDRVADCLWRDQLPARPAEQVSVLVSRLRSVLGAERVRRSDAGYTLAVDWLDIDALGDYAEEAQRRLEAGALGASRAAAAAGISLLRGPLLADEPDAWWAEPERRAADRLVAELYRTAAAGAVAAADWVGVVETANEALLIDPFDEPVLRTLMDALVRSGRPASALAAYSEVRARLADELGVSPSAETEALHTAILLGDVAVGATEDAATGEVADELPGRDDAIADLDALFGRVERSEGQVALVEGEAGIGKSRLLEVWSRRVAARGAAVVVIACDELGRGLPLQPVLDAIELLIRRADGGVGEVLGADVAVLGPLLGAPPSPAEAAQLAALTDPGAGQALLFAALFSVLRRQAERGPLVVVFDDVHLADAATTVWLAQAPRRLVGSRVAIVAARRSEEGSAVPGVTRVALGPLDLDAATRIVGPDRAAVLYARSGGHPLFLVELAASGANDDVPATIRDAVEARCARAGVAGPTLRAAAVIGSEVDLDVLAAVTGAAPSELLDHLEEGVRRRFLIEDGPTFVFAHTLVRDALEASVGASRAAYIHREAARALDTRPGADPLAVARHARLGGDVARAAAMLVTGARIAVSRFDQQEALRLLDEAVALDDTVEARLERARVRSMLGQYELAAEDVAMARSQGAGAEALEVAAWAAHFERRFDLALELADQGSRQATDRDVRASCLALGGWVSLAAGDLDGAQTRLEEAVGEPPGSGGPTADAPVPSRRMAEAWLGWLRASQGRPAETLALIRREDGTGLAAYRFPNAYAMMAATMALAMLGRADEALAAADALETDVARMGARRWVPRPLNLRSWVVRNLGEMTQADELNHAAIDAARAEGVAEPLAHGLLDLAAGRLFVDDLDAAGRLIDEAARLGEVEHAFRWRHELRGRLLRARFELASGQAPDALERSAALAIDAAALGVPRYEVQARLVAAMAAQRLGEHVDFDDVGRLLVRLGDLAGLEAWWITADTARSFGIAAWEDLAGQRVGALLARAGDYAGALERCAGRRLR